MALLIWQVAAQAAPAVSYDSGMDIHKPVKAKQGMVASVEANATQAGLDILRQGGNAVDAAVAVGYALAVTYPQAGNLGGGGFMVLRTQDGRVSTIDFREMAPGKASRDMFLDEKGEVDSKRSLTTHLAVGVPGTVAGLSLALEKYGTLPLKQVMAPAITLAEEGFIVNDKLAADLALYGREVLLQRANSKAIFFNEKGEPWQAGERLQQLALARSLKHIADEGQAAFYQGAIAEQIVQEMSEHNGLISKEDLLNYRAVERKPVTGQYRGYEIISMPPPSSGGIHIVQILNILEKFDLKSMGQNSAQALHLMAEAMKFAYADRSEYLGDPDFTKVPVSALLSKSYAAGLAAKINQQQAQVADNIKPGNLAPYEGEQTTHYSVVDKEGNAVAVTYTLNTNFGSGIVAGNSGILLNNEMDDFSAKPGTANVYGLIGGEANGIEAKKRPLSSMSPTIITKGGKVVLVTGSPGGSRII
ncbi:MAG: gamma-glutamyltransferase, partial [Enterobacteriaceae bacterium]